MGEVARCRAHFSGITLPDGVFGVVSRPVGPIGTGHDDANMSWLSGARARRLWSAWLVAIFILLTGRPGGATSTWYKNCDACLECAARDYELSLPDDSASDCLGPLYRVATDPTSLGAFDSPWHDTPLTPDGRPLSDGVVHMICEIPMGATAKLEIRPDVVGNPLLQDTSEDGQARFVAPQPWSYGMVPQTWEAPVPVHPPGERFRQVIGDGDPVDIVEISGLPMEAGEAYAVKVLGAIPLIDSGEMDWKIVSIRESDPRAAGLGSLADVQQAFPGTLEALVKHFREYKIAAGGAENEVANGGRPVDRDATLHMVEALRGHWEQALAVRNCHPRRRRSIALEAVRGMHACDTECCWAVPSAGLEGHDEL